MTAGKPTRRLTAPLAAVLMLAAVVVYLAFTQQPATGPHADAVAAAFRNRTSGVMVEAAGEVVAVLADDHKGSRHQRFILRLPSGHTVLVAHNIDLAPRIDALERGHIVRFRGQYEWNERGGLIHWTHHDPGGRRPGGWIEHAGKQYR